LFCIADDASTIIINHFCRPSGYKYSACVGDPRTANSLTSSNASLPTDVVMRLSLGTPYDFNAKVDVYQLSTLGQIKLRLGSLQLSASRSLRYNSTGYNGSFALNGSNAAYQDLCFPSGSYSVVFIASSLAAASTVNTQLTISGFQATADPCTFHGDSTNGKCPDGIFLMILSFCRLF